MKDKLKKIFMTALEVDESVVEELKYRDYKWDSIVHMMIVSEIENEFDIMMETEDIIDMSSFKKAVEIIEKYLV